MGIKSTGVSVSGVRLWTESFDRSSFGNPKKPLPKRGGACGVSPSGRTREATHLWHHCPDIRHYLLELLPEGRPARKRGAVTHIVDTPRSAGLNLLSAWLLTARVLSSIPFLSSLCVWWTLFGVSGVIIVSCGCYNMYFLGYGDLGARAGN